MNITHSQWICRNITNHHSFLGKITLGTCQAILAEVERQLELGVDGLPPKISCLLEVNPTNLYEAYNATQQYWLNSITVAQVAGEEPLKQTQGNLTAGAQSKK